MRADPLFVGIDVGTSGARASLRRGLQWVFAASFVSSRLFNPGKVSAV